MSGELEIPPVPYLGVSVLALASPSLGTLKQTRNPLLLRHSLMSKVAIPPANITTPFPPNTQRGFRHHARKES